MKPRHKIYLRLNLVSLFFVAVSFMSVTLAWFAYSGLAKVSTEVGVKAWYIELEKNGEAVSNDIVISVPEVYPGMDVVNEIVNIKNLGDSDAQVKYSIVSARVMDNEEDNYVVDETTTNSEYVEDLLSHEYPFHININLNKGYVLSKGTESSFEVSISWPLDSDSDTLDSVWGTEAYKFQKSEETKKLEDANYQIRPSIEVVISVTAEQYLKADTSSDIHYNLGDTVLFDVANNKVCTKINSACIKTHIIDVNNELGDETVTLLPDPNSTYLSGTYNNYNSLLSSMTSNWNVSTRSLLVEDLLKPISTDVMNSFLSRDNISDSIIGSLNNGNRINSEIAKAVSYNGYYSFINQNYAYLSANSCYWTSSEYNNSDGFAVKNIDADHSKIYGEAKTSSCNVVPVIVASKSSFQGDTTNAYKEYNVGDQIVLADGSTWHVLEESNSDKSSVTILKDVSLGIMPFDTNGYREYSTSTYCSAASYGGCNAYKAVSGTYSNNGIEGTVTKNSSLYDYLNVSYRQQLISNNVTGIVGDIVLITKTEYESLKEFSYSWLNSGTYWWTMTQSPSNNVDVYAIGTIGDVYTTLVNNGSNFNVRPVMSIIKEKSN